ncbi:hypothetical protein FBU30_006209 [Linnemannia zychae]|nr:hypothetical protein FBU30_006209 [Linnemannia zychae]
MSLFTTTYVTTSAALNLDRLSPFSMRNPSPHACGMNFSDGDLGVEDKNNATIRMMLENSLNSVSDLMQSERSESEPACSTLLSVITTSVPTGSSSDITLSSPFNGLQDLHLTDGSILRCNGTSFRNVSPSPTATTISSSSSSSLSFTKYRKDKGGEFQCPFAGCDYRYNLKREFNRHRNVHVFAGKDKYRCVNCGSGLCRLDSVKRHMEAKGKADCLKKGLYEEFHESGQFSLIRKCKPGWYEAAAVARSATSSKKK